jgi:MSHA pilin protein MshD
MRLTPSRFAQKSAAGFTLVELVIGIVVLAVALVLLTSILGPLYQRGADPWHQVRATELGHSLMNEIMARSFDEKSDRAGGEFRCDATASIETGAEPCTAIPVLADPLACKDQVAQAAVCSGSSCWGPETNETSRESYDDVDDFHGFVGSGAALSNIIGGSLANDYLNYKVCVDVRYAGTELGAVSNRAAKKITINVIVPSGDQIDFSAYRSNW